MKQNTKNYSMVSKKVRRGDDEEKKSQAENDTEASRPTTSAVTPECEGSPHPSWRTEPRAQRRLAEARSHYHAYSRGRRREKGALANVNHRKTGVHTLVSHRANFETRHASGTEKGNPAML